MVDFFKSKKTDTVPIDKSASIELARYVVIDTELTGLDEKKDSIVSIGAVRMLGSKIDLGDTFHRLIKPETGFKRESVIIHGITPSDVRNEQHIDMVIEEFLQFCGNDILVGHCVSIDLGFINREMKRILGHTIQNPAIDTFKVYEWLKNKVPARGCFAATPRDSALFEVAKCFGITVRGAHDALVDSFITAQLFQRFIPVLIDIGVKHIGEVLTIGGPTEKDDKFRLRREISNF